MMILLSYATIFCLLLLQHVPAETAAAAVASGSYRKDYYLPKFVELIDDNKPTKGGRVHVVVNQHTCTLPVTSVKVNGQQALGLDTDDPDFTYFDWTRIHGDKDTIWFSFHSRNTDWLDSSDSPKLDLDMSGSNGTKCFSGSVSVHRYFPLTLTYGTTANNFRKVLMYVNNPTGSAVVMKGANVNGQPVAAASGVTVEARQTKILSIDASPALQAGDIWSITVSTQNATAGWGGRVLPELFPLQAWPKSEDCPLPPSVGGDEKTYDDATRLGIDTVFLGTSNCGNPWTIAESLAEKGLSTRLALKSKLLGPIKNLSNVASIFIGDEVDGKLDDNLRDDNPRKSNKQWPGLPTYQGAKTNSHIGAYAGITDIQGCDAYIAACAPTIVAAVETLPLNYPYQYLRNTRNNHMPLPTWLYSQLYSDAWSYQPHENEIVAQVAMTVLAGAKGVTVFQSYEEMIRKYSTENIATALQTIRALREDFRSGDIGGAIISSSAKLNSDIIAAVVRSPTKVILVLLNIKARGYNTLTCHVFLGTHWTFSKQTVDSVELTLPQDIKVGNPREQVGNTSQPVSGVSISGNTVKLSNVQLDDELLARYFVFDVSSS
eukprot:g2008.t1